MTVDPGSCDIFTAADDDRAGRHVINAETTPSGWHIRHTHIGNGYVRTDVCHPEYALGSFSNIWRP